MIKDSGYSQYELLHLLIQGFAYTTERLTYMYCSPQKIQDRI